MGTANVIRRALFGRRWVKAVAAVLVVGAVIGSAVGVDTLPPLVELASEPIYARGARAKPTLTLALSVEFPTVGAQYVGAARATTDESYSPDNEYVGYFGSEMCYVYKNVGADSHFAPARTADHRKCGGSAFSGNFMNWATSSAIDILRYALTGGDRVIDTADLTVLQRAYLPTTEANNAANFWNGINFPGKIVSNTVARDAMPVDMIGSHLGNVYIANCRNRVHFGTAMAGSCDDPGANADLGSSLATVGAQKSSDPFFYARVAVCATDGDESEVRSETALCQRYPNGKYKPVGNLQRHADDLRVAAFGYVNDNQDASQRYGGVLRVPMKYVGAKTFDDDFALMPGGNPGQEWSGVDGTLIANASLRSKVKSGVINYLNQFGRAGDPPGLYKRRDPVSELYYEALRYLQGLQPTDDGALPTTSAIADIGDTGGFPVVRTWDDPHPAVSEMTDYSCVRNNIVTIGDSNTNADLYIPGNPAGRATTNDPQRGFDLGANVPNFWEWTRVVGGFESNDSIGYVDGEGRSRATSNPFPPQVNGELRDLGNKYTGTGDAGYYMAGMAYWANTHDIRGSQWSDAEKQRPGMRVTTFMLDVNEFGEQTPYTARRNSPYFLAAKYGGFTDSSKTGSPFVQEKSDGTTVPSNANWESPSAPGEPKNYYLSSSARGVIQAFDEIFLNLTREANSIAGGAISSQRLSEDQDYLYQAQFDPSDWSGDVVATPVSASASGVVSVDGPSVLPWTSVATLLDNRVARDHGTTRKIFVGPAASTSGAAEFVWVDELPAYVRRAMKAPIDPRDPDATDEVARQRLNYLRGDRRQESATPPFRSRGRVLGDIVNSGIVYSGALDSRYQASVYGPFYRENFNRTRALFVGANDGMLHAFNASSGQELFAYVPSWVVPRLPALTSPTYQHQSYVDATPVVAEAKVGADWKTVLVGGTGAGGQGVYALDVTNPDPARGTSPFNADKVLWEFTDKDDADLGNVVGTPQILPFRTNASTDGGTKYYAVVASGVNNHAADGNKSATGAAALFLLDLDKAPRARWEEGVNYHKLVFPDPLAAIANGMINFTARFDYQGNVGSLYAGDLQGNLWKLDFAKPSPSPGPAESGYWSVGNLSSFVNASGGAIPMYIAEDAGAPAKRQPISMGPALVFGANQSIVVSFGTGKFIELADVATSSFVTQSVYSLLDDGGSVVDSNRAALDGRPKLQQGSVSGTTVSVAPFVWSRSPAGETSARAGWYFDFPESNNGERQVSGFAVSNGKLVFGSVIPAQNSCGEGGGNLYVIDLQTGDGTFQVSTVGVFGEPMVVRVEDAGAVLTNSDSTGRRQQTIRTQIIVRGSSGTAAPESLSTLETRAVGRLSWRELSNYQQLRQQP